MADRYYIEMGLRLKAARDRKGYSLQFVGDRVGKSKKTILNYETAVHTIDTLMLKDICNVLDIDVKQLLNDLMQYL
jgi:repressor LexA